MEELNWSSWAITLAVVVIAFYIYKYMSSKSNKNKKLPPSPPCLPIIGHLHMLKKPLHETIHKISSKYGDILLLKLGVRKVLVISSPLAVEECLVKNDTVFANRPDTLVGRLLHYNNKSIAFSPYNHHFTTLKKLLTQEVFSSTKIPLYSSIRKDECHILLRHLYEICSNSNKFVKLDLNQGLTDLGLNIMTRMTAAKRYFGKEVEDPVQAKEFKQLMKEGSILSAADNPVDFLPMLRFLFRGLENQMVSWMNKTDRFYQRLVDERKQMSGKVDTKAVIDVLIAAQQQDPVFFTNDVIKGIIMVLILAGSDTSSSTMVWAMSLLLNNPEAMKKVYAEIETVVGRDRLMNEDDVSKLPYLQNVINETLRLYPPTPLLLPHESSEDSTICGYHVPGGTMLMVSLWTIHRDPKLWSEPERFNPDRFQGKEGDSLYKLLPFGLGRRTCPGYAMGKRAICLVVGSLIQCFEWERISKDLVDMSVCSGITMIKEKPLETLCKVRPYITNLLAEQFNV